MLGVTDEWLVSILSVQQCALCIVAWPLVVHVSSCCITASALHNVVVPYKLDDRVVNYICWEATY